MKLLVHRIELREYVGTQPECAEADEEICQPAAEQAGHDTAEQASEYRSAGARYLRLRFAARIAFRLGAGRGIAGTTLLFHSLRSDLISPRNQPIGVRRSADHRNRAQTHTQQRSVQ